MQEEINKTNYKIQKTYTAKIMNSIVHKSITFCSENLRTKSMSKHHCHGSFIMLCFFVLFFKSKL